uniref:Uncharacterized protein n=1 Tax=Caulerpa verticillata TaxID=177082 RepID=A0A386B096_9CHLO|nr:hypothetical protein [Caulerpa verticillata]AYC65126.1 hypothetical protein [Caulerpa verticillata]
MSEQTSEDLNIADNLEVNVSDFLNPIDLATLDLDAANKMRTQLVLSGYNTETENKNTVMLVETGDQIHLKILRVSLAMLAKPHQILAVDWVSRGKPHHRELCYIQIAGASLRACELASFGSSRSLPLTSSAR